MWDDWATDPLEAIAVDVEQECAHSSDSTGEVAADKVQSHDDVTNQENGPPNDVVPCDNHAPLGTVCSEEEKPACDEEDDPLAAVAASPFGKADKVEVEARAVCDPSVAASPSDKVEAPAPVACGPRDEPFAAVAALLPDKVEAPAPAACDPRDDSFVSQKAVQRATDSADDQAMDVEMPEWVSVVMDILGPHLRDSHWGDGAITYGSDCSGIDSPRWALSQLVEALQVRHRKKLKLVYEFASEAPGKEGLWQKRLLLLNDPPPRILYDDMLARGEEEGPDFVNGGHCEVPRVQWYTGGFECQDLSNLNVSRKSLSLNITEESGMSSRTLSQSLKYIKSKRPAFVVLENVSKKKTGEIVCAELTQMGYICCCLFANSSSYGVPQSRSRLYVAAVCADQVHVEHGPLQWIQWLQEISTRAVAPPFSSYMLPNDDGLVQNFLADRQKHPKTQQEIIESLEKGASWPKCFEKHQEARSCIQTMLGKKVPSCRQLFKKYANEWSKTLPAREQDVLYLHLFVLEQHRGRPDFPVIWDLTHNVTFAAWKEEQYEEKLPCLLRKHRYYHCGQQRLILGCELLRGQGFPKSIKTSGRVVAARDPDFSDPDHNTVCDVPDAQLNSIAGNTISVPVVGSIMACMMAGCQLVTAPTDAANKAAVANAMWPIRFPNAQSSTDGVWVGSQRIAAHAGRFDCIHMAAKPEASSASKRRLEASSHDADVSKQKTLKQCGW